MSASRFLRCAAAGADGEGEGEFLAAAPRLYDFSHQQRRDGGACLLTLQRCGAGWGVRRRIRYVGDRRAGPAQDPPLVQSSVVAHGDDQSSCNAEKLNQPEAEEDDEEVAAEEGGEDESRVVATEKKRKRKKSGRSRGGAKRPEKTRRREEREPAPKVDKAKPAEAMVDRWTASRYVAGEECMVRILRALTARAGGGGSRYVRRTELRAEARKHIGDTGLLDHLLKHMADKVPAGSDERLRRRHNADGAMEYWLEPAELAGVRREAGVSDPYWVPPPGWKPGDPVLPDVCALQVKRKVEELATELAGAKRQMNQLKSSVRQVSKEMKSEAEKAYAAWQEKYDCVVKANSNLEKQVLSLEEKYENAMQSNGELEEEVLFLKEKYEAALEKNTRLEKQMAELSTSFMSLKDDLFLLNTGEQLMMELEQADLFAKETCRIDKQESNAGRELEDADLCAGSRPADATAVDSDGTSNFGVTDARASTGKRTTSRKCSVRICNPEGPFQWPDMAVLAPLSPLTPMAEAAIAIAGDANAVANLASMDELDEYMMAGGLPTPSSASSTNGAADGKLPLLPGSAPASPPVQPPPSTTSARDVLQIAQPYSGALAMPPSSSSSAPCGASLLEGKKAMIDAGAGGGNVGTELALATPSY